MTAATGWLPRLQAIERCSDYRCDYLAWLLRLPCGCVLTGAFGWSPRDLSLWPNLDAALDAFGPGTIVDDAPDRHMTGGEAASALEVVRAERAPASAGDSEVAAEDQPRQGGPGAVWRCHVHTASPPIFAGCRRPAVGGGTQPSELRSHSNEDGL
jgi:hypothetical protein